MHHSRGAKVGCPPKCRLTIIGLSSYALFTPLSLTAKSHEVLAYFTVCVCITIVLPSWFYSAIDTYLFRRVPLPQLSSNRMPPSQSGLLPIYTIQRILRGLLPRHAFLFCCLLLKFTKSQIAKLRMERKKLLFMNGLRPWIEWTLRIWNAKGMQ